MKKIFITAVLTVSLALCACSRSTDISGTYTAEGLDNIYIFTADGKIYMNDETESYSRYRVEGNKIITYIDGSDDELSLPFKKTDEGFMMGKLAYRKLPEYDSLNDAEHEPSESEPNEEKKSSSENENGTEEGSKGSDVQSDNAEQE